MRWRLPRLNRFMEKVRKGPAKDDRRVYFDVNIYRQLEDGSWKPVRAALRKDRYRVIVGDPVIGEAIAIPDADHRLGQIRCICSLRDEWTDGVPGEEMATESYRLLRRFKPDWITGNSRKALIADYRNRRTRALTGLAENIEQQRLWNENIAPLVRDSAEDLRRWQKESLDAIQGQSFREALMDRIPSGVRLPDSMPDSELQWRLLAAERLHDVSNGRRVEQVNYLGDIRPGLTAAEWCEFWLNTTFSSADAPATAMHGLARFYQLQRSLRGTGNLVDAMHLTAALGCSRFVTSDSGLAEVLSSVRSEMGPPAPKPVLVPYGAIQAQDLINALRR